jgi:DNA-binding NarL/FixJ family response regulator
MNTERILEAKTGREALAIAKAQSLDMIVLDLNLPELGGLEVLARLRQVGSMPILVLSMHAEPIYVTRALEAGAQGYVSKNASPEELLTAVRQVGAGGRYVEHELAQAPVLHSQVPTASLAQLAPRDLEILRHLAAGRSLGEIADALGLRLQDHRQQLQPDQNQARRHQDRRPAAARPGSGRLLTLRRRSRCGIGPGGVS